MSILNKIKSSIKARMDLQNRRAEWRRINEHNFTTMGDINCPFDVIEIGKGTYGPINVSWFCVKEEKLKIGNFCSIARDVRFLTGGNHPLKTLSSYPFEQCYPTGVSYLAPFKGPIIVEDDVWIATDVIVLSGVTIGQGAVIAAGSVVAKDVPPYAIFIGNKVIKYRFDDETIKKLLKFDYSKLNEDEIKKNRELLSSDIDDSFFETDFYKNHLKEECL